MENFPTHEPIVPAAVDTSINGARSIVSVRSTDSSSSSRGVQRMEAIAEVLTRQDRWRIFVSLFVFAFAYSLNHSINGGSYSMFPSKNDLKESLVVSPVVWPITAAVTYFVFAKIADVFGRLELILVSLVFDAAGTAVMNAGSSALTFHLGKILHQIGYAAMLLLSEVIVADLTSLKTRLFFSSLPLWPTLPIPWLDTYIMAKAPFMGSGLRWFLIMWSLIVPVSAIPLMMSLWMPLRRATQEERAVRAVSALRKRDVRGLTTKLFWEIDAIGLALLIAIFASILVPFTMAGDSLHISEEWSTARILVPVLIGAVILLPLWVVWEQRAKTPLISATLLSDRIVWAALGTSCMLTFCWSVQAKFITNVLMIVFGDSAESVAENNIESLYSVSSVIVSTLVGCAVLRMRQLKPFIVMGSALMIVVFGILVKFHHGGSSPRVGFIAAQILLGIAWGFILEPTKALIQAATQHDDIAAVTGLYMATSSIGIALGNAVSGAIWKQTIVPALIRALPIPGNTMDMAVDIYENPVVYLVLHHEGSPIRNAMTQAYGHGQMLVAITGLCLCAPLLAATFCLRNPEMGDERFVTVEGDEKELIEDVSRPRRAWTWLWA